MTSDELQKKLTINMMDRLSKFGSNEYLTTWKPQVTPAGRLLFRLAALALRTSGNGCGGWATPMVNDELGSDYCYGPKREGETRAKFYKLPGMAKMAGWPSPATTDYKGSVQGKKLEARKSMTRGVRLPEEVQRAGWQTPHAPREHDSNNRESTYLGRQVSGLIPSPSPAPMESGEGCLAGWPSPCRNEPCDNVKIQKYRETGKRYSPTGYKQPRGLMLEETAIATLSGKTTLKLNPYFSLWLMGFPIEWGFCGVRVTR